MNIEKQQQDLLASIKEEFKKPKLEFEKTSAFLDSVWFQPSSGRFLYNDKFIGYEVIAPLIENGTLIFIEIEIHQSEHMLRYRLSNPNLIREKLKKVCEYGKNIQGRIFFGSPFQSDRNEMARAVIFEIKWREFMDFTHQCHDTWTKEEEDKGIELLDFLIQVCESSSDTWELFWQGKQPMNPKRMPFRSVNENKVEYVDLTEVEKIEIPFLGIKG